MRKMYTAIDIGSDSIKVVVVELFNDKYYVLASTDKKTDGVKKGLIVDKTLVSESIKSAVKDIETMISLKIENAIVIIPSNGRNLSVVSSTVEVDSEDGIISGEDVANCLNECAVDAISIDEELITVTPITFTVDDNNSTIDPKGMKAEQLSVKAIMTTVPRQNIVPLLDVFSMCNIEIEDVIFSTVGDYYEARTKETDGVAGAIINIGSETIKLSIFNKGIMIKDDIIPLGSKNIDKDISYMYGLDLVESKKVKENFAVCSRRYADNNDIISIDIPNDESVSINQYEITEIVEARVVELLKLAKKRINDLTNKKISYIIVTGGITELSGFGYVVENVLGINASTLNITTLGIRNNKYSSVVGSIKYFCEKLKMKDLNYSMINKANIDKMMNDKKSLLDIVDNK